MRKKCLAAVSLGALVFCILFRSAHAGERVALVIGNSSYQNVVALKNPGPDAAAMADMLRKGGFDVVETANDLTLAAMRRTLRSFSRTAEAADVAVVYYAGHGIEINGTNYLIPT